jgi:ankyrin repeat protein
MAMSENGAEKPTYWAPAAGEHGMTELHYAAYCNDPDAVREQLELGAPVDVRDDGGWTPLFWSIDMSQAWGEPTRVVSILLAAGASPNAVDHSGRTVLMVACGRNSPDILEELVKAGANIQARSADTTPLHEAAVSGFREAVELLLAMGADPNEKDSKNRTAQQLAELVGFDDTTAVFRAGGNRL